MTEVVRRLISIDPYWWPMIGAGLVILGLLVRRLRGQKVDWEVESLEWIPIVVCTFLAFAAEAFGEPYGWDVVAVLCMAIAVTFALAALVFRLGVARLVKDFEGPAQGWHPTSIICSLAALCLTTGKFVHTWLLFDQADNVLAITRTTNWFGAMASVVGMVAIVMIVIEVGAGLKYRWQHRGPAVPGNVL